MGDVIDLKPISLADNQEFVSDCCRFQEGIASEKAIRKKYRMAESAWEALALDDELVRAIEAESVRRIRDGSSKREKSQQLITKAPDILDSIASDVSASPRHRVDAIKTLDGMAAVGPAGVPAADRFIINIVLNSDGSGSEPAALHFNKSIRPLSPGEVDPDDIGPDTDTGVIAAITAKEPTENGGGCESI